MFVPPPESPDPEREPIPRIGDEAAYAFAWQLIAAGVPGDAVRRELGKLGLDQKTASVYVGHLLTNPPAPSKRDRPHRAARKFEQQASEAVREAYRRSMRRGAILFASGLLATILMLVVSLGSLSIMAVLLMLSGAILFCRGFLQLYQSDFK